MEEGPLPSLPMLDERATSQRRDPMNHRMLNNPKSVLIIVACICFAIAVLQTAGSFSFGKIDWTNLGLFFGFLSFIV